MAPYPHSPLSPLQRTQHNTHTHHLTQAKEDSSRKESPPCFQLRHPQPARERERECDDERGGAVTKHVAAAGGASRFAVAEEGKEELLPSRQSPSCFLVADEGVARTVAIAEEGDAQEGAVMVVAIVAVEKSKFYRFDKEGNRWKERTAGTVKFPKNKVASKNKIIAERGSLANFSQELQKLEEYCMNQKSIDSMVYFLNKFCTLSKSLQMVQQLRLFRVLMNEGIFDVIIQVLQSQDKKLVLIGTDILILFLNQDPILLQSYVVRQEGITLLGFLVKGMITEFGDNMHCQFLEILHSLLDMNVFG
ncbi:uncharacterized protein LOC107459943 [Arachis duranensis]|uniref:Uncharacterized protein LOC107459943 n=2 Tax=Arachis TaxID=3817 RepID=A0A9C6TEV4_ARADU|nr:uncharacterized protein LOC107459943 [Arachis duranensis]